MPKNEDEITPLSTDDNIVEVATGGDSPKSKSPRHGHSTSKEVSTVTSKSKTALTCCAPPGFVQYTSQRKPYLPYLSHIFGFQVASAVTSSWVSRRFLSGWCEALQLSPAFTPAPSINLLTRHLAICSAVLFPLVVTVYITWWFLTFFDNFFSVSATSSICSCTPLYASESIHKMLAAGL